MVKLAIFDFDGTLFLDQTVPFVLEKYTELGYAKVRQSRVKRSLLWLFFQYKMLKKYDRENFRALASKKVLKLFEGFDSDEVAEFFQRLAPRVMPLIDQEVLAALRQKRQAGFETVILSGCYDVMLAPLKEALGVDRIIATAFSLTDLVTVSGEEKVKALYGVYDPGTVDLAGSYAYGDSVYDGHVLDLVGHPVMVNPEGEARRFAEEKGYEIWVTGKNSGN